MEKDKQQRVCPQCGEWFECEKYEPGGRMCDICFDNIAPLGNCVFDCMEDCTEECKKKHGRVL